MYIKTQPKGDKRESKDRAPKIQIPTQPKSDKREVKDRAPKVQIPADDGESHLIVIIPKCRANDEPWRTILQSRDK